MKEKKLYKMLIQNFPFAPTTRQNAVLQKLSRFVVSEHENELFLLKGYAGTGKTTLVSSLVRSLESVNYKAVLLAPTGRAAKVVANYSGQIAYTIHRHIYYPKVTKSNGIAFSLKQNKNKKTIFIVDEASMISDTPSESKLYDNGSLLNDLLLYVYSEYRCKLILVGDTAQLPPVRLDTSPALQAQKLATAFLKEITEVELDEVVRQAQESGILHNATRLREQLHNGFYSDFRFSVAGFGDIIRMLDGHEILDALQTAYSEAKDEAVVILRSNKRANTYNRQIRAKVFGHEAEVCPGDYLMVVKNNYFWLDSASDAGFIANGDIIKLLELSAVESLYGFRFAKAKVALVDYLDQKPLDTILLLDTLSSQTPALSYEDSDRLYQEVRKDFEDEKSKYSKFTKVKNSPYFNALQVKFSYAITCHKSQGGQWNHVFIEHPYLPDGVTKEYLRWLYTAMTRAKKKLYLMGFTSSFFENGSS